MPECLFLPGLATATVKEAIKDLYLKCDTACILNMLETKSFVKQELLDIEEKEPKHDIVENCESDDHNYEESYDVNVSLKECPDDSDEHKFSEQNVKEELLCQTERESKEGKFKKQKYSDEYKTSDLIQHMMNKHNRRNEEIFKENPNESRNCQYCEKVLKTSTTMKEHLAIIHRKEVLLNHPDIVLSTPCQNCDMMFFGIRDLDQHSRNAHNKSLRTWTCNICKDSFDNVSIYRKHRRDTHKDELLALGLKAGAESKCAYCDKILKECYLKRHIFNVHKDKRYLHPEIPILYSCTECDEQFCDQAAMKRHQAMFHTQSVECQVCSKLCLSELALKSHMLSHSKDVHICHICCKEFNTKSKFKAHLKIHDSTQKSNYRFVCNLCKTGRYHNEETYQKHILDDHSGKVYICSHCPMNFSNIAARQIHEKRNHTEKTIMCDHCDMMFSLMCHKNAHIKSVHIKAKNKICPHCGQGFAGKHQYEAHVNRHTDTRENPCELCGKAFLHETHLRMHMKTHTLPYQCDQCETRVSSGSLLQEHVRKVHEGIHLNCRFGCSWQGLDRRNLARHEASCKHNPIPNAPFSVSNGTANKFTLDAFKSKLNK